MAAGPPRLGRRLDPAVPDRRASDRPPEEAWRWAGTALSAGLAICGGLVLLFVFVIVIGSVNLGNAVVATVVVALLAAIWVAGFLYRRRMQLSISRVIRRDRERRGF
ncbi:MAG: hypothetical protein NVSMB25_01600 [Thermoleophilaceae bacterium]